MVFPEVQSWFRVLITLPWGPGFNSIPSQNSRPWTTEEDIGIDFQTLYIMAYVCMWTLLHLTYYIHTKKPYTYEYKDKKFRDRLGMYSYS